MHTASYILGKTAALTKLGLSVPAIGLGATGAAIGAALPLPLNPWLRAGIGAAAGGTIGYNIEQRMNRPYTMNNALLSASAGYPADLSGYYGVP